MKRVYVFCFSSALALLLNLQSRSASAATIFVHAEAAGVDACTEINFGSYDSFLDQTAMRFKLLPLTNQYRFITACDPLATQIFVGIFEGSDSDIASYRASDQFNYQHGNFALNFVVEDVNPSKHLTT